MRWSLLELALSMSAEVRQSERKALDKQREEKQRRQEMLRSKKLIAAQSEYANALALMFLEMFHSPACWRTVHEIHRNFNELGSDTAQREAMKTQIRIRVIGLGWKDLGHAWSKNGYVYSG